MLKVDINSSNELQALVRTLKSMDKPVQEAVRTQTRKEALSIWSETTRGHSQTVYEARLAGTARVKVSQQNVTLTAASVKGVAFSGGLDLRKSWASIERGASQTKTSTYQRRSKKGGSHQVTRRVMRGFRPRKTGGYVLNPAQHESAGRIISLWHQTAIRAAWDALDKIGKK